MKLIKEKSGILKIIVYAIAKNEEIHVLEWYNSMKEADAIYVLDTGSLDDTVKLLKKCPKVHVKQKVINPWRFDVARNESLKMVPKDVDICVCTDIDERLESGWREKLERVWEKGVTKVEYTDVRYLNKDGSYGGIQKGTKIHARNNYKWVYPVHECIQPISSEKIVTAREIVLVHHDKKTVRSNYTKLLELAVEEEPGIARHRFLLGREYYVYKQYDKAIKQFHKYIRISDWEDEKSFVLRYMGKCYQEMNYIEEALLWFDKSRQLTPNYREPYYELGRCYYYINDIENAYKYLKKASRIKEKSSYMNDFESWNGSVYDYLSLAAYKLRKYKEAYQNGKKALEYFPNDARIKKNIEIYAEKLESSKT